MLTSRSRRSRVLLAGGLLMLTAPSAAVAATPDKGEVSSANPTVQWTGAVENSYFNRVPVLLADIAGHGDKVPCAPKTCDSFALKVAQSDDLVIKADAPESTSQTGDSGSQVTLRITKPDGSKELHTTEAGGASPDKPLTVKIKKAPAGDYTIEYFNYFYGGAIEYTASATLGTAKAAAPVAPPVVVAPAPDQATAPVAPIVQEGLTVTAKVGKASAKKLAKSKKLAATVTVSRAVTGLTATLKSGSKVVGKGTLGGFSGTKTVNVKVAKKLKAGKYTLVVAATDSAGTTSAGTVAVKVTK